MKLILDKTDVQKKFLEKVREFHNPKKWSKTPSLKFYPGDIEVKHFKLSVQKIIALVDRVEYHDSQQFAKHIKEIEGLPVYAVT